MIKRFYQSVPGGLSSILNIKGQRWHIVLGLRPNGCTQSAPALDHCGGYSEFNQIRRPAPTSAARRDERIAKPASSPSSYPASPIEFRLDPASGVPTPVLARELETGTYRYAWTQGFGRERWTIAKLALLAVAVTAAAWAFSQVLVWFFQPFQAQEDLTVFSATVFAIGALAGMFIRRIVPAMAVTLAAYTGLALATWLFLREHYPLALVTSNPSINSGPFSVNDPWVLNTSYTGPGDKPASGGYARERDRDAGRR